MKNSEKIHEQLRALLLITDFFLVIETVFWPSYGSAKKRPLQKNQMEKPPATVNVNVKDLFA